MSVRGFSCIWRPFRPWPNRKIRCQPHEPGNRIQVNRKKDHRCHESVLKYIPWHTRIRQYQHPPEPDGKDDETQRDVEQHPADVVIALLAPLECNSTRRAVRSQMKPILQHRPAATVGT